MYIDYGGKQRTQDPDYDIQRIEKETPMARNAQVIAMAYRIIERGKTYPMT